MTKSKKVRLCYGIFLLLLTVVVGIVFIIQAADIYYGGIADNPSAPPFTVQSIKEHLTLPLILLIIYAAAVVAGFVLSVIFPLKETIKLTNSRKTLKKLQKVLPVSETDRNIKSSFFKFNIVRIVLWSVALAELSAAAIVVTAYCFTPSNFHANSLGPDILELVRNVIFWLGAGLVLIIIALIIEEVLVRREIKLLKQELSTGKKATKNKQANEKEFNITTIFASGIAICLVLTVSAIIMAVIDKGFSSLSYQLIVAVASVLALTLTCFVIVGLRTGSYNKDRILKIFSIVLAALMAAAAVAGFVAMPFIIDNYMDNASRGVIVLMLGIVVLTVGAMIINHLIRSYVPQKADKIIVWATRGVIGVVSIVFIVIGVLNGGAHDVLIKGINICTECIGLG